MADNAKPTPASVSKDDDFTVAYYENGRFRLCLYTSDPGKIPRFRQAVDCVEAILRLPKYPPRPDEDIDGEWAE